MSQEKTEKPSRRKLEQAHKKGQSPRSAEAAQAIGLIAILATLPMTFVRLRDALSGSLVDGLRVANNPSEAVALHLFRHGIVEAGRAMAPFIVIVALSSSLAQFAIVGGRFNRHALLPKFERLKPSVGIKRLFSRQVVWEFIRTALKLGAVIIVLMTAWSDLSTNLIAVAAPPARLFSMMGVALQSMLSRVAVLALAVGAADAVVSRRRYLRGVKMTKQEARDEMRHAEGDPKIKGEVRRRMFRMSRMRMMAEVSRATVVIANPTHFAVALRYDDESPAPIVVAKGADHIALRIRAEAEKHNVPVVEERPLARALYQAVEIGDTIPVAFYQAVAQVLAVIMRSQVAA